MQVEKRISRVLGAALLVVLAFLPGTSLAATEQCETQQVTPRRSVSKCVIRNGHRIVAVERCEIRRVSARRIVKVCNR